MSLALSSAAETAWWVTLAAGLVVSLVVWGLLEVLRREVNRINENVNSLWGMGKRLAQNTQLGHALNSTRERGAELSEEVERHRALSERSRR